jgi:hypothetical protein
MTVTLYDVHSFGKLYLTQMNLHFNVIQCMCIDLPYRDKRLH